MELLENKAKQMELVRQSIIDQGVCSDLAAQAKNLVFGDGNLNSDIVFIGEAPGKREDDTGLPFVGAAGRFLNDMLAMISMNRQEIYITNIVKYRPPDNRDPLPDEKKAFLPYLQQQLEIIGPQVVVTLGRHAGSCFLPDIKISRDHGKPKRITLRYAGNDLIIVILPLFHPAAALYNGSMRQTLIDDFVQIPDIIRQLQPQLAKQI